jgi:hypothetical protein
VEIKGKVMKTVGFGASAVIAMFLTLALAGDAAAQSRCRVTDPTGTPLNVRSSPNGPIVGTLRNGLLVSIIGSRSDRNGRDWVNVASYETRRSLGWVFREFISCF